MRAKSLVRHRFIDYFITIQARQKSSPLPGDRVCFKPDCCAGPGWFTCPITETGTTDSQGSSLGPRFQLDEALRCYGTCRERASSHWETMCSGYDRTAEIFAMEDIKLSMVCFSTKCHRGTTQLALPQEALGKLLPILDLL